MMVRVKQTLTGCPMFFPSPDEDLQKTPRLNPGWLATNRDVMYLGPHNPKVGIGEVPTDLWNGWQICVSGRQGRAFSLLVDWYHGQMLTTRPCWPTWSPRSNSGPITQSGL